MKSLMRKPFYIIGAVIAVVFVGIVFWTYPPSQPAAIIAPLGGEKFFVDKPIEIRWTPGNPGIRQIDLIPQSFVPIVLYQVSVFGYPVYDTSGSYTFTPRERGVPVGDYYVKIYSATSGGDMTGTSPIRIIPSAPPPVTVKSPNGGEVFGPGEPIRIFWSGGRNKVWVGIANGEYRQGTTDPLMAWVTKDGVPDGSVSWDGKLCVVANDCRPVSYWQPSGVIRAVVVSENSDGDYCTWADRPCNLDASDGTFMIKAAPSPPASATPPSPAVVSAPAPTAAPKKPAVVAPVPVKPKTTATRPPSPTSASANEGVPALTVRVPNGGESFRAGSPMEIGWMAKNAPSEMLVSITVFMKKPAEGRDYVWIANAAYKTKNDGKEAWSIPADIASGNDYYVRIGCDYPPNYPSRGCRTDDSDAALSIVNGSGPAIKAAEPAPVPEKEKAIVPLSNPPEQPGFFGRIWKAFRSLFGGD